MEPFVLPGSVFRVWGPGARGFGGSWVYGLGFRVHGVGAGVTASDGEGEEPDHVRTNEPTRACQGLGFRV